MLPCEEADATSMLNQLLKWNKTSLVPPFKTKTVTFPGLSPLYVSLTIVLKEAIVRESAVTKQHEDCFPHIGFLDRTPGSLLEPQRKASRCDSPVETAVASADCQIGFCHSAMFQHMIQL